jgi:hypothetical protein
VESSRTSADCAATAGDRKIDLTDEAGRAVDSAVGPLVSQRSATLAQPTPKEDDVHPTFENSDDELEYLQHEDACLEKQRTIECLRTRVLGKAIHQ